MKVARSSLMISTVLPRVHRVVSLLKRWLIRTHQGTVNHEHLDYYLDEFTFRLNRRMSWANGNYFIGCRKMRSACHKRRF